MQVENDYDKDGFAVCIARGCSAAELAIARLVTSLNLCQYDQCPAADPERDTPNTEKDWRLRRQADACRAGKAEIKADRRRSVGAPRLLP
jgi:hypothetical protein